MALSDAAVWQAKPTGKDYTLGDIDGLSLAVTATGGGRGISVSAGAGSKSLCRWAPIRRSVCVTRVPIGTKRANDWRKGSIPRRIAGTPVKPTGKQKKTRLRVRSTTGSSTGRSPSRKAGKARCLRFGGSLTRMCCPRWASAPLVKFVARICWRCWRGSRGWARCGLRWSRMPWRMRSTLSRKRV